MEPYSADAVAEMRTRGVAVAEMAAAVERSIQSQAAVAAARPGALDLRAFTSQAGTELRALAKEARATDRAAVVAQRLDDSEARAAARLAEKRDKARLRKNAKARARRAARANAAVVEQGRRRHAMITRRLIQEVLDTDRAARPSERAVLARHFEASKCARCRTVKPLNHFHRNQASESGVGVHCIACVNEYYNNRSDAKAFASLAQGCLTRARLRGELGGDIDGPYLSQLYEQQGGRCAYSGRHLVLKPERNTTLRHENTARDTRLEARTEARAPSMTYHNMNKVSVDRVDPRRGYEKGNVQLVSVHTNFAKLDLLEEDFLALVRDIHAFRGL